MISQKLLDYIIDKWGAEAARHGYNFVGEIGQDGAPFFYLEDGYEDMPSVIIDTVPYGYHGSTVYQFQCNLVFPSINYVIEDDYADSTEYLLKKWTDFATSFITPFQEWVLDPEGYEE